MACIFSYSTSNGNASRIHKLADLSRVNELQKLQALWDQEVKACAAINTRPSLLRVLVRAHGREFAVGNMFKLPQDLLLFAGPFLLERLVRFVDPLVFPLSRLLLSMSLYLPSPPLFYVYLCVDLLILLPPSLSPFFGPLLVPRPLSLLCVCVCVCLCVCVCVCVCVRERERES